MYKDIQSSVIHNSQKLVSTNCPSRPLEWINVKWIHTLQHIHSMEYYIATKKEPTTAIYSNIDQSHRHGERSQTHKTTYLTVPFI